MTERTRETEDWRNARGESFHISHWAPAGDVEAKAVLLIHHGLGEHAGRYERYVQGLAAAPIDIWAYDIRGHGKSDGPRGHADGLDGLVDDLEVMIDLVLERTGASKLFLLGHSLGGATVVHYLVRRKTHPKLAGVVLSAPPARIEKTASVKVKLAIGKVLGAVAPRLAMSNGLDTNGISSVPEEVEAYVKDPLVHDRISAALGLSLTSDGERNLEDAGKIEVPLLVYAGSADPLVNPADAKAIHDAASSRDKTFHAFEGKRHEVHSEDDATREELCALTRRWIEERL